ncbi:sodium-dependent bicarbonate transport family permease [Gloeomargarita sp.]
MDFLAPLFTGFIKQLQSPTLSFLIGGLVVAALGSQLVIPEAICQIIIFMLLMKIGLTGGMAIRNANLTEMVLPVIFSMALGILIVFIARFTLARLPRVKVVDAVATGGLFGAVSGSTMAAALTTLEEQNISFEAWAGALYPFMDIPALVTAIVVANVYLSQKRRQAASEEYFRKEPVVAGDYPGPRREYFSTPAVSQQIRIWPIIKESLQGPALSSMLLGIALGLFAQPESVYKSFYEPLFRGLLSILMLVMGMEAWSRVGELRKVAQWYVVYSVIAPFVHGLIAFALGMVAHYLTGFSLGGVMVLAVIAASSSDISGPPTLRAGIPSANPSAYIGASTAIGTPVAISLCIPFFLGLIRLFGAGAS